MKIHRVPAVSVDKPPRPAAPPRRGLRYVLVLLVSIFLVLPVGAGPVGEGEAAAEQPARGDVPDPVLDAMEEVAAMAGEWEGEGWMRMGPGEPATFHSRETVESRLGGRALLIEGLHHARTDDGGRGPAVHHALALLTWNTGAGEYDFRTYVAHRGAGDFTGRMEDGAFVWGGETPRGQMRYTIRIEGDTWDETGELSQDGETWTPFFGMKLKRVGD